MDAGQILLKHGLLSDADLSRAVDARTNGSRVDQMAVDMGMVGEADALRAWAPRRASTSSTWKRRRSTCRCCAVSAEADSPPRPVSGRAPPRGGRRGDVRSAQSLSARRSGRGAGLPDRPGARHARGDRQADQDAPRRRQRDDRRPAGPARGGRGRAGRRPAGRRRRDRRRGAGGVGRSPGERDSARSHRLAGERRAHRVAALGREGSLPHRRPAAAAADAAGDQPLSGRDHQPPEDHGAAEHRREAAAAGRPHQAEGPRPRGRRPRVGHPHAARRGDRHAYSRQGPHGVLAGEARHAGQHARQRSTS